jgi:hypothetical protein
VSIFVGPPPRAEIRTATLVYDDGILCVRVHANARQTIGDIQESFACYAQLSGGPQRLRIMVDLRTGGFQDAETRKYLASADAARYQRAVALLVGSPVSRMAASFFLGLNKLLVPVRVFADEAEAVEWLKGFRMEEQP